MIKRSDDGKLRVLSLSYGKDSLACIGAIEQLGLPLDAIVHAEVWATDDIPADLPPMVEFKKKADSIIKERWGFEVNRMRDKKSYQDIFYTKRRNAKNEMNNGKIYGFPMRSGAWCNSMLKMTAISKIRKQMRRCVDYVGIAEDEPERLARLDAQKALSPLHLAGWTESDARKWCEENDLLSPIYTTATRGGVFNWDAVEAVYYTEVER